MELSYKHNLHGRDSEISLGDRVALRIDGFQEYGWVKWVGRKSPHDGSCELLAGVELDNPLGSDNHKLNGRNLFEALPNHGILLPASRLIRIEDLLPEHSSPAIGRGCTYKKNKSEAPLGGDLSQLSTFHKMAFEQLTNNVEKCSQGNKAFSSHSSIPSSYCDKENLEILPHMSYPSHKDLIINGKETLNDIKNKSVRSKNRTSGKNLSHLLEDWKPLNSSICINGPATNLPVVNKRDGKFYGSSAHSYSKDSTSNIGVSGGIIGREDDRDCDDSPTNSTWNALTHLSRNGVDQLEVLSSGEDNCGSRDELDEITEDLVVGSMVEVFPKDSSATDGSSKPLFGVIRWIGTVAGDLKEGRLVAGVEMEDVEDGLSDGTLKGKRYFSCPIGKAIFVPLSMCSKDRRFLESLSSNSRASLAFGSLDCQPVLGNVPPLVNTEEVRAMFGRNKGIQGHQNSCYLDATLFSMFAFTSVFDGLLFRPSLPTDIKEYMEVQTVLREEIVNPLRKNMYVRADRIMKLRTMLDSLSSVSGLTTEEKDPEEFLQSLLAQILQADPFLQLSSGQETYHYQLFVDKDDRLNLPSVQTLFDQSFLTSDIKLKQIPSCLIIQMPRFGKDYKMYPRILPSMVLDVTDVIEDSPRQCIICGKLADYECKECFGHCGSGLESIAFCAKCMDKVHCHKKRGCHKSTRKLKIPAEFQMLADHCVTIPRVYMELFAVVCIETSHYVSFTRCGSGAEATWCFFDSMADRKGEQHGYNIPTVVECGDLMQWVGEEGSQTLHTVTDNRSLPDLPRRLLCDAYMCFYQSPKVMMYR